LLEQHAAQLLQRPVAGSESPEVLIEQDFVKTDTLAHLQDLGAVELLLKGMETQVRRLSEGRVTTLDTPVQSTKKETGSPSESPERQHSTAESGNQELQVRGTTSTFSLIRDDHNSNAPQQKTVLTDDTRGMTGSGELPMELRNEKAPDEPKPLREHLIHPSQKSLPQSTEPRQETKQASPSVLVRDIPGSFPPEYQEVHPPHVASHATPVPSQPTPFLQRPTAPPSLENTSFLESNEPNVIPLRTSSRKPSIHNDCSHSTTISHDSSKKSSIHSNRSHHSNTPISHISSKASSKPGTPNYHSSKPSSGFTYRLSDSNDFNWETRFVYEPLSNAIHQDKDSVIEIRARSPSKVHGRRKRNQSDKTDENHGKHRARSESQGTSSDSEELGIKCITVKVHFERRQDLVLKINLRGEGRGIVSVGSEGSC